MASPAHLGHPAYCRRNFVASAAAASIVSCALGRSLPARAQGEIEEIIPTLDANREDAEALFEEVILKIDPSFDDETGDRLSQRHYELRFDLASTLHPLSQTSQVMLVDPSHATVALIMSSYEDIQLVPAPDEVEKIDLNEIATPVEAFHVTATALLFFLYWT